MIDSLWNISTQLNEVYEMLQQQDGEMSDLDIEIFNHVYQELENKTDSVIHFVESSKANIKFLKEQRIKLSDAIKARENALERFNTYVLNCLLKTGKTEFKGELGCIKQRKPAMVLEITNPDLIPPEFLEIEETVKVKKDEIKRAIKDGETVFGAELKPSVKPSINYKLNK